jgi:O-antigen/teichoic acid export membrane protein
LWILTPGGIFLACGQVTANVLRGLNRQLVVARAEGIALIFTLVLLAALLPAIGVAGAAIASTVPYGVSLGLMLRHLRRMPSVTSEGRN